ncbi:MAG TPA: sigma-70 family RNA polymerase sigma factor [Kofleriaceae bacterium]|nr:sigma-70 family RNA polymerase sigma factor [Kofleriaceae bacterium]
MADDAPNDDALLAAWRAGDAACGAQLVERHFAMVCRFFRTKLGDDVGDLIQQTFADCIASRDTIVVSFKAFLMQIARRRFFDHLRDVYKLGPEEPLELHSFADSTSSAVTKLARHEREKALLAAMQRLPLRDQMLLQLSYWDQLSAPEIGAVLDMPANSVRGALSRARQELRNHLAAVDSNWETTLTEFAK